MKSRTIHHYIIPLVVVVCSLVLLAALTFAIGGFRLNPPARVLYVDFQDVTGIKLHSPVKYAGASAGSVLNIRYLKPKERAAQPRLTIRLTLEILDEVPELPKDVKAAVGSETMLGEKMILLTGGSLDGAKLASGDVIVGDATGSIDALAKSAQAAIEKVGDIIEKLKADYPKILPRVTGLLDSGTNTMKTVNVAFGEAADILGKFRGDYTNLIPRVVGLLLQSSNLLNHADGSVTNVQIVTENLKADYQNLAPRLQSIIAEVQQVATNLNTAVLKGGVVMNRTDALISESTNDFQKILAELRVVSQNLKVVSTYTKALAETLAQKPSRLLWGSKTRELPTEAEILKSDQPILIPPDCDK